MSGPIATPAVGGAATGATKPDLLIGAVEPVAVGRAGAFGSLDETGDVAVSAPVGDFVRDVARMWGGPTVPALMAALAPELRRLLAEPRLLPPELCAPPAAAYAQHVLYTDPTRGFSLVALVWRPGTATPIHDHRAWGLAGCYRGRELETRFAWCDRPGAGPGLRVADRREVCPGEVIPIVPPDDVHRVLAPGPLPTVSLHLYGCDVSAAVGGSSVRRVYPANLVVGAGALRAAVS